MPSRPLILRGVILVFIAGGVTLALLFKPLLAPRMAMNEAFHEMSAGQPLKAYVLLEVALARRPDDKELQALLREAAVAYAKDLTRSTGPSAGQAWLAAQANRHPFLIATGSPARP